MKNNRAKILLVDDDTRLLDLLVDTLDSIGYETIGVQDGVAALEKLQHDKYDLMISDIKMPGMDGISLLKKVRRQYPQLPVLFITGYAAPEIVGRATPDGFLAKPFRISHIEELIENTLAGKKEQVDNPIRRVLIVDDDDTFRETLIDIMHAYNYIPFSASGAVDALRELEKREIDVVITDIKMPGMDGIALLNAIKEKYPEMPVILITAFSSPLMTDYDSDAVSADGFLQKPFRAENIITLLKDLSTITTDVDH